MGTSTANMPAARRIPRPNLGGRAPAWIVGAVCMVIAVIIAVWGGPTQIINTLVTGGIWALMSIGLALIFGVMNIPNFAHGEAFMVGAYVAYFVFTPLQAYMVQHPSLFLRVTAPFAGIIAATLVGAALGVLIDRLIFRALRHRTKENWIMNAFLLTVGIAYVMQNGALLILGPGYRGVPSYWTSGTLQFLGIRVAIDRIVVFLIALVVIAIVWNFLQRSNTGRAIRAVSQDETGAQLVGIPLDSIQTLTMALATATAALAGSTLLFLFPAYPTVGMNPLYFSWYVVMLVGLGNVPGAIIGGFIVALLQTATQQFVGIAWINVVPVILMIIVLLVAPSGIFGSEVKGIQEQ
jgi:branched-chain amino acid transport system permease protein